MSKDLRVDPVVVRMAADHVDVAATELQAGHVSAHERMGAAQAGWIGASAAALAATTAKWEDESARHYTAIVGHSEDFRAAAERYAATDDTAAADIDGVAGSVEL